MSVLNRGKVVYLLVFLFGELIFRQMFFLKKVSRNLLLGGNFRSIIIDSSKLKDLEDFRPTIPLIFLHF